MKSLIQSAVALSLLTFASAPFAQDDVEEEGGFFSGIADFFTGMFSSDDEADEPASSGDGTFEFYAGGQYGFTKYEEENLDMSQGFSYYGGLSMDNRWGAEVGFFDFGPAEIKDSGGIEVETDGLRAMITAATAIGDAPVRLGLGYYRLDSAIAGVAGDTAGGVTFGVKFEQAVTNNIFLTLGTDFFFNIKGDSNAPGTDAVVFGIGIAYHTDPPMVRESDDEEEDGGVGVTPVDDGYGGGDYGDYGDYGSEAADDSGDAGDYGGDESFEEEPAPVGGAPAADDYGYGDDAADESSSDESSGDDFEEPGEEDYLPE